MTNQVFDVDDPCPNQPSAYENRQAAELYRDARLWRENAQVLADVRTLDDWVLAEKGRWVDMDSDAPGLSCVLHDQTPEGDWNFDGVTLDVARAKAAEWVRKQAAAANESAYCGCAPGTLLCPH